MLRWTRWSSSSAGSASSSSSKARSVPDRAAPRLQVSIRVLACGTFIVLPPGPGRTCRSGRFGERLLGRLGDVIVPLPTFVLQLDVLDQDRVGVGIEIGLGLGIPG